jgi:hypothetical protein
MAASNREVPMIYAAVGVVGLAAVLGGMLIEHRHADSKLGGPGQKRLLQEALYTGKPPAGVDPDRWIAYLKRRRPPMNIAIHAAAVGAVLIGVTVRSVMEPGGYGLDDIGDLLLLVVTFAVVYAWRWRIIRGAADFNKPAKAELLSNLERLRS